MYSLRRLERTHPSTTTAPPTPMTEIDEKYGRNVRSVVLGDILITPWYSSLYREERVGSGVVDRLFICPRCFKYTDQDTFHVAHMENCHGAEMPGTLIYEKGDYAIYEVDGAKDWMFTTNISLFAKLFIDNKSVCFDVEGFLYYLLVDLTVAEDEPRVVGFFSKEKLSWDSNNLACIVVFPPWQRRGLGQILMGASYEIGKREHQIGGPERRESLFPRSQNCLNEWLTRLSVQHCRYPANEATLHTGHAPLQDLFWATSPRRRLQSRALARRRACGRKKSSRRSRRWMC